VEARKIRPVLESYLDEITWRPFGLLRTNCVIDRRILQGSGFTFATSTNPRTRYLEVDGTTKGASIFINRQLKGYIERSFAISPGEYLVEAMLCIWKVRIAPNDEQRRFCDKA
jgi:hypothetical protein